MLPGSETEPEQGQASPDSINAHVEHGRRASGFEALMKLIQAGKGQSQQEGTGSPARLPGRCGIGPKGPPEQEAEDKVFSDMGGLAKQGMQEFDGRETQTRKEEF